MADQIMFSVAENGTDEHGNFVRIVIIHHDENRGNGDPNEAFFAVSAGSLPGGDKLVMDHPEFSSATDQDYPWLAEIVNRQFDKAKKIRDIKKVTNLRGIRKVTAAFLQKALDTVTA